MIGMLTVLSMERRLPGIVALLAILCGCATSASKTQPSSDGNNNWGTETPLARAGKTEVSDEAKALAHFLKGQLLIQEGAFDDAIKEFEAAAQASPRDGFLHFRLATLYLRRGDLRKALTEAETAAASEPNSVENRLLLAGLYSSHGDTQNALQQYDEVLKIDPKNQEALLYLGALNLQLEDYPRA